MSSTHRSESSATPSRPPKGRYEKPRLIDYGDIRTLTQLNASGPFSDGGVDPNFRSQSFP